MAEMTEHVLPYDRAIVPQLTGWWCGPASAQVVLNGLGLTVPEAQLAREIGTHTGGTDYIGLIERVLDQRVPDCQYTSVYTPNDPLTAAQKERFWAHLVQSVVGNRATRTRHRREVVRSTNTCRHRLAKHLKEHAWKQHST